MSRKLIESNCKLYKDDLNLEFDSEKDSLDLNDNLLLYDDNDFINYNMASFDDNKNEIKKEEDHIVRTNRINSCSILDVLKNRISFDETI